MLGCRSWQRGYDGGRADLKHYVGYQLLGQSAQEGLAERGELDYQGIYVAAQAAVLDVSCRTKEHIFAGPFVRL